MHSAKDMKLIGIQPYMLARSTEEGQERYKALWEPLNKLVNGYDFSASPSAKVSGRCEVVSAQAPAQHAITISFKNFLFDTSPSLALLR